MGELPINILPGFLFQALSVSCSSEHVQPGLLQMGLPLSLDKLTAEELLYCFDEVCPCGHEHTGDAFKKQRRRLAKDIEAARSWEQDFRNSTDERSPGKT